MSLWKITFPSGRSCVLRQEDRLDVAAARVVRVCRTAPHDEAPEERAAWETLEAALRLWKPQEARTYPAPAAGPENSDTGS